MRRAFIIVDMLEDFIAADGILTTGEAGRAIVPAIRKRLAAARTAGDLIIYLCDSHRPDDREFEMFPPHCIVGTKGAAVIEELTPKRDELILPKRRYSGFFGTQLDLCLRENRITELELVGVCTNICVLYTAADARNLGYAVTVHRDSVASFDPAAHDWALEQMASVLGCQVK